MAEGATWTDLLDPTEQAVRESTSASLRPDAVAQLLRPSAPDSQARPALQSHGSYVFGVLLFPVALPAENRVFYQEVDLVLTHDSVLTVRKTPGAEAPFERRRVQEVCEARERPSAGAIAYYLVDEMAERYLELLDALNDEIDELEDEVTRRPPHWTDKRVSELRHDLLHIRHRLSPARDAVRGVVDGRVDIRGRPLLRREVFPREIERDFAGVYDKLLRATEAAEFARDLLSAVREHHQARLANTQNEIIKRVTAIASLLLFPTFWVGVYGQNFDHMPELGWRLGYLFSWGVIVVVTIGQLILFRRKGWL